MLDFWKIRQGRYRSPLARDVSNVMRNRFSTATEVRTRLFKISRTIWRQLTERNLKAFRSVRVSHQY